MRLVTWNCNGALNRKFDALMALEPDVAVVQECAAPEKFRSQVRDRIGRVEWVGRLPTKGIAVMGFGDWKVEPSGLLDERLEWLLPVEIDGGARINLLGVWSMNRRAKAVHPDRPERGQVRQALALYGSWLAERPTVLAGDFNNAVRWDKSGKEANFANVARDLEDLGLVSAYHTTRRVGLGEEADATHYWRDRTADGPRYHIDYVFVPEAWADGGTRVHVGRHADWIAARVSDHVPLIVDVELGSDGGTK